MTTLPSSGCAGTGAATVADRLRDLAGVRGAGAAVTALGCSPATATLTWARLDAAADSVAAWVRPRCAPGDRVAVVTGHSPFGVAAFLGVLRAGRTAVPLDLPTDGESADLLVASVVDSDPAMVLSTWSRTARLRSLLGGPRARVLPADALPAPDEPPEPDPVSADPACFAYVRDPGSWLTGVELTHADLWAGAVRTADALLAGTVAEVVVSGLSPATPLGIALGIGVPLVTGTRSVLLDPADLVREPGRWVAALADTPGCAAAAAGVTFALAAERGTGTHRARPRLDRVAALLDLGGDSQHSGVDRFLEAFAGCGLPPSVKRTAYAPWDLPPVVASDGTGVPVVGFDSRGLGRGEAVPAGFSRPVSVLSGSGRPAPGSVLVVDPVTGVPLADGRVGEILVGTVGFRAPRRGGLSFPGSTGRGATADGDRVRTGDLGVLRRGELFVLGPAAQTLAAGGLLLTAHDVERAAQVAHPAVRAGGVAAFTVPAGVVVVVERSRSSRAGVATGAEVANAVRAAVRACFGVEVHEVVLVEAGEAARCEHGGVLRRAARDRYLAGPGIPG